MRTPRRLITTLALPLLLCAPGQAEAQLISDAHGNPGTAGSAVDRNVGDTGPNAVSHRAVQPGLGQFGVGTLLLDRFGQSRLNDPRSNPNLDPRTQQRYLLSSPGYHALIERPDYIGPSTQGGWAFNTQTRDGAEVLTLSPANTVFVLSPEILQAQANARAAAQAQALQDDSPYRVQLRTQHDHGRYMKNTQTDYRVKPRPVGTAPAQKKYHAPPNNYRHPAIIERERKLREEREQEQREKDRRELEALQKQATQEADTTGVESNTTPDDSK